MLARAVMPVVFVRRPISGGTLLRNGETKAKDANLCGGF